MKQFTEFDKIQKNNILTAKYNSEFFLPKLMTTLIKIELSSKM